MEGWRALYRNLLAAFAGAQGHGCRRSVSRGDRDPVMRPSGFPSMDRLDRLILNLEFVPPLRPTIMLPDCGRRPQQEK